MTRRALVSVSDKTGIVDFVEGLVDLDYEIISTGGTAQKLRAGGIDVIDVSEVTQFPEMMDGRVKTLHPKIHGGLLALRDNEQHMEELDEQKIVPIDMVVVNLYPFAETINQEDVTLAEALENIDIGGPSMIRSAAKNFRDVAVVTEPDDYSSILTIMRENEGELPLEEKQNLAVKAFQKTAGYDQMIYDYLSTRDKKEKEGGLPDNFVLNVDKKMDLRYGENPHQKAAFYVDSRITEPSVTNAEKLHGKELSFNNINDTDGALELIKEFREPTAAVIKHTNPCGLATAENIHDAYVQAHAGDPMSAFGSIVALNRPVDVETAEEIAGPDKFVEVVIAPDYEQGAVDILAERWDSVRLLKTGDLQRESVRDEYEIKKVTGGLLVQDRNDLIYNEKDLEVVTDSKPDTAQMEDLLFAWTAVKHVKSNSIVMARNKALVGVGAGQMSRVDAMIIAGRKAGERTAGAVVASDAFFPFRDAIDKAAENQIEAIIQPGGSIRDDEVIEAANEHGIAMVMTGNRHFKH
ncbi:MAG: bifunctional phosphoribosylaminoimidazolecarboxamide formyltransferase/IMP cyclohydrolase [Halanaerobiaceae bacterium]